MYSSEFTELKTKVRRYRRLKDQLHDYYLHNKVEYVEQGRAFFRVLKSMIDGAKDSIHLQTYIFEDDETGRFIGNALAAAAKRGVAVYVLVDGYASQKLSGTFLADIREAGVRFRLFSPFFKSRHFYFGRRLHHKIVVVDGETALVGSMNIADKYNDVGDEKAWLDRALHIKGDVAPELQRICVRFWEGKKWRMLRKRKAATPSDKKFPESYQTPVRVRQNDWINRKGQATRTYFQIFHSAKKYICVVCSYVLPDSTLRAQLERAAKRGVEIYFVLAGTSDVKVVKTAERYLYRWMFRNKMKLYEYQPAVLHVKMAIADDEILTLGSYNLNNLSAYASVELNVDVRDSELVRIVRDDISKVIQKDCIVVPLEDYMTRLFSWKQFMRWCAYVVTRIGEKLITKKGKGINAH
jgi:cardiolipin synthase